MPLMEMLTAGGKAAQGVGGIIDSVFGAYNDHQNLKINRENSREQRRASELARLLKVLEAGQGVTDSLANRGRLYALRNQGV